MRKFKALLVAAVLLPMLSASCCAPAWAYSILMRPASGQPAPGTQNQLNNSTVSPDSRGNFAITDYLTALGMLGYGWVFTTPGNSVNALGNVTAGTTNFDLSRGCTITETLTGNVTHTFTNAGYCQGAPVCVNITQDGTGSRAVTWTGFTGSTPPQPNQTAAASDTICFSDDGTHLTWPVTGTNPVFNTVGANGGTIGGCTWSVTLSSGAGTSTQTACLAQCSNVSIQGLSAALGGGAPTTLATPTTGVENVRCAQPSAAATVVKCLSSYASDAQVVSGNCSN